MRKKASVYPYVPNSAPAAREKMLQEIGVGDVEELYAEIPKPLRFKGKLHLPKPFLSELGLRRHVESLLAKNKTCKENLNFLGGGCWQHYVPAVCDEIASRAEFLTAYAGDTYTDLGKGQAFFEYQSMIGELLAMDVVSSPTYDWLSAASSSLLMASRITGRKAVLLPTTISADKLRHMRNFCGPALETNTIGYEPGSGQLDLKDLKERISSKTAAV